MGLIIGSKQNTWTWECKCLIIQPHPPLHFTFIRHFYPKQLTVAIIFFVSMCVPWELNPQPFALLSQCSTIEPQEYHWATFNVFIQLFLLHYLSFLSLYTSHN